MHAMNLEICFHLGVDSCLLTWQECTSPVNSRGKKSQWKPRTLLGPFQKSQILQTCYTRTRVTTLPGVSLSLVNDDKSTFDSLGSEASTAGIVNGETFPENNSLSNESILDEKEALRRKRISIANGGKVPWNKGKKWTKEMKEKIRARTLETMNNPMMREKLRELSNKRTPGRPCTPESRDKIRKSLQSMNNAKKTATLLAKYISNEWKAAISEFAGVGLPGDEELEWKNSRAIWYKGGSPLTQRIAKPMAAELETEEQKRMKLQKGEEHRRKIAEAVRAKWQDPEYREKVRLGMGRAERASRPAIKRPPREKKPKPPSDKANEKALRVLDLVAKDQPEEVPSADFLAAVMGTSDETLEARRLQKVCIIDRMSASKTVPDSLPTLAMKNVLEKEDHEVEEVDTEEIHSSHLPQGSLLRISADNQIFALERRQQLTEKARVLMEEADRATRALENSNNLDDIARASLEEARRLLQEAANSIRAAEAGPDMHSDGALCLEQLLESGLMGSIGKDIPAHRAIFKAFVMQEVGVKEQWSGDSRPQ